MTEKTPYLAPACETLEMSLDGVILALSDPSNPFSNNQETDW